MAKNLLVLATVALSLSVGTGWAQTSLIPKSDPRLPPQAGQGLPRDDVLFLKNAMRLNTLQTQAATLAAEKAQDDQVKQLAATILQDHGNEMKRIEELARKRNVTLEPTEASAPGAQALDRLNAAEGEAFDRAYIDLELHVHEQIVDLYQTQASNSPDTGLAAFAITSLVPIQEHFDHVKALGAERGLTIDTVGQPPQY